LSERIIDSGEQKLSVNALGFFSSDVLLFDKAASFRLREGSCLLSLSRLEIVPFEPGTRLHRYSCEKPAPSCGKPLNTEYHTAFAPPQDRQSVAKHESADLLNVSGSVKEMHANSAYIRFPRSLLGPRQR
jgi:hypothetical protein